ncbi:MAG TPA: peptidylprolyl isomerase [Gemmatimonadales bacterium]
MRRLGLMLLVLTLAGCAALRDAFSAHPEVVGAAAGQVLTVERLADLLGHAKRVPLRPDVFTGVGNVYLDYAMFAVSLARGRDLHDSALVLAAQWPKVSQLKWEHFHDRLVAARAAVSPQETDSAYRAGGVRLFQHILLRVPPSAAPPVEQEKRRQAEALLRQTAAQHGTNFAHLAQRYSDDPGSKVRGGFLPAAARGQFVPAFDSVAWNLEPGAISGVIRSPFGFHIIRRPPLSEVRDSFQADLENGRTIHFDSLYIDSLAILRDVRVKAGAPALVRQAVPEIVAARTDRRTLATYRGGALRISDLARWLMALNPEDVRGIARASDRDLQQFVKRLAEQDILLAQVDSAGVGLTPDDWQQVRADHDSMIAILERLTALSPELLKDSASSEQARIELAMARVNAYLDRAVKEGKAQFFPVPPFLAGALRQGQPFSLNDAGIARALERAQAIRAADSSGHAAPPTGLKPAPGPPPIPTDSATGAPR